MSRTESPTPRIVFGMLLAALGVIFLSVNFGWLQIDFSRLWPFFPLSAGLVFLAVHLIDGSPGTRWALIPGCIVTCVSLVLFLIAFNLVDMAFFWPLFPLSVGVAFLAMYALGIREDRWPLYPGTVLTSLGLIFFLTNSVGWRWWPLALVIAGLIVMLRPD